MAQNNWWSNKWGNIQPTFSTVKNLWKGFLKIWKDSEIVFGQADFTWGELEIIQEVAVKGGKGDFGSVAQEWNRDQKKKKRVIKLLAKINGKKYEEEKNLKEIRLTARDAKLIFEKTKKMHVNVLNESVKLVGENKWHINSIQIKTKNLNAP